MLQHSVRSATPRTPNYDGMLKHIRMRRQIRCVTSARITAQVVSAFEVPKILYDPVRKCFYKAEAPCKLLGSAQACFIYLLARWPACLCDGPLTVRRLPVNAHHSCNQPLG